MSHLPNAIIVGAQKCGTTTLFYSLAHHSKVHIPIDPDENKVIKEVDFFLMKTNGKKE